MVTIEVNLSTKKEGWIKNYYTQTLHLGCLSVIFKAQNINCDTLKSIDDGVFRYDFITCLQNGYGNQSHLITNYGEKNNVVVFFVLFVVLRK